MTNVDHLSIGSVSLPDWWWPGWLIALTIFFVLTLLLAWLLFRWGQKQVDEMMKDEDE